jgi:hypothetical protein
MKVETRTLYRCEHCKKHYLTKHSCVTHETFCAKNPANKHACFRCEHLVVDRENSDDGYSEKTFTCSKLEKQLHSFKAEKIKHGCLGYTERMPLQCDSFKDAFDFPLSEDFSF